MIERNIISRDNYLYHLSQLEYGSPSWHKACDQLLIEAGRLEGQYEENERRWREVKDDNSNNQISNSDIQRNS